MSETEKKIWAPQSAMINTRWNENTKKALELFDKASDVTLAIEERREAVHEYQKCLSIACDRKIRCELAEDIGKGQGVTTWVQQPGEADSIDLDMTYMHIRMPGQNAFNVPIPPWMRLPLAEWMNDHPQPSPSDEEEAEEWLRQLDEFVEVATEKWGPDQPEEMN